LIALAYFAYVAITALALDVAAGTLALVMLLSAGTFTTLVVVRRNRSRATWLGVAADLFPALLILVAYRESGVLLRADSARHLDSLFIGWDRALLHSRRVEALLQAGAPWLQHYLELAYLLCYPLVPLGALAVFLELRRRARMMALSNSNESAGACGTSVADKWRTSGMDGFWAAVLLATLFSYAVYPFFPLTPPRVLYGDVPGPHVEPVLRQWNFWLLNHFSVQACMFPSGHVAATTAVALALRKHLPRLGGLFLFLAASIAAATVYGRYHYAADALAGALVAFAAYRIAQRWA
jgi:membrane-associated phospholipid phosphatase